MFVVKPSAIESAMDSGLPHCPYCVTSAQKRDVTIGRALRWLMINTL